MQISLGILTKPIYQKIKSNSRMEGWRAMVATPSISDPSQSKFGMWAIRTILPLKQSHIYCDQQSDSPLPPLKTVKTHHH